MNYMAFRCVIKYEHRLLMFYLYNRNKTDYVAYFNGDLASYKNAMKDSFLCVFLVTKTLS